MSTKRRHDDYLEDIRQAALRACRFVEGMSQGEFIDDERTQQAVAMSLIIIGEAATKISERYPDFIHEHPQIPWNLIRGMRNRIAHAYFSINWPRVWDTVHKDLPHLIEAIKPYIGAVEDDEADGPRP
jgi:uncharacterized protein with HEPN domain